MTEPGIPQDVLATAREGADSVFRYVERTAIENAGECRWRTLTYDNKYTEDEATVFNGAAGIAVFLADYHRLTGSPRARELAAGAAHWSESRVPGMLDTWLAPDAPCRALCFGRTGIGLAWLRLHLATRDPAHLARVRPYVDALHAYDPAQAKVVVTDYLGGVAGLPGLRARAGRHRALPRRPPPGHGRSQVGKARPGMRRHPRPPRRARPGRAQLALRRGLDRRRQDPVVPWLTRRRPLLHRRL